MKQKLMLALAAAFMTVTAFAQTAIKGKIIDGETGQAVEGAVIRIDRDLGGFTSNTEGEFTITGLKEGEHTLRINHISYLPAKVTVSPSDSIVVIKLEENNMNLGQVVVTGTGTHHRMANTPVPVSVITAKDLQKSSATNLEEVLTKLNPAFSFSTNGMGTTMTLNGVKQDYVLILVNGKKVAGDDTYSRINTENIKRVEILNGAASALYGSDAIGGVINIITDEPKNTVSATSSTRLSSHQRLTESVNITAGGKKVSSYTNYKYAQAGNWQLNKYDEDGLLTGKMNSTGFRSHNAEEKITFDVNRNLSFYARGNYYNYTTDRPENTLSQSAKDPEVFSPAYTYDLKHESFLYGAGMKYIIDSKSYLEADFYSDNYKAEKEYMGNDDKNEAGTRTLDKKIKYYNGNVKGIFKLGKKNKLSAGTEYVYETLNSEKTKSSDPINESMYTISLYAQDEWQIGKGFSAVGGVRYVYHRNFKSYATPNISLMYNYKGFNVRASYAGGFRTPDLSQIYTTTESSGSTKLILPNTNLKPEKSNYFALNLEYNHARFSISATGYYNSLHDMINYRIFTPEEAADMGYGEYSEVKQRANIDRARIAGVNVSANAYLGAGFSLGAGYAFNDAYDITQKHPLDKSLKHSGVVNLDWKHTWKFYQLSININGRIQGERYSELYDPAPQFSLWDLNTRHKFTLKHVILEPGIGIENIFNYKDDRPWNNNFATLTPGRSFYVSLIISFIK